MLLNNGADPRLHAGDGTSPLQVSLRTSGKENRKKYNDYFLIHAIIYLLRIPGGCYKGGRRVPKILEY